MDVVSPEKRSQMMSGIRGKNTKPEIIIRKALHGKGFRYRLHVRNLPGKPDIVLPKYQAVVFVNGCFWHKHDCHLFKWPKSRPDFWKKKILRNQENDAIAAEQLLGEGWRVLTVWECALKGKTRLPFHKVMNDIAGWIESDANRKEIAGMKV